MGYHVGQCAEVAQSLQRRFQPAAPSAGLQHVFVQRLDARLQVQQAGGHRAQQGFQLVAKQGGVNLQVEVQVGMVRAEKLQQIAGAPGVVVEGAVQDADVADAVCADIFQSPGDGFHGEAAHGFLPAADAEGTSVEAASGGFQLHEGLVPVEERALFGRNEAVEACHARRAVVPVGAGFRVDVAQSGHVRPPLALLPQGQPLGEDFFAFASEDGIDPGRAAQVTLVVAQKFGATQDDDTLRQQRPDAGQEVEQGFVGEEPGGCGQQVGAAADYFIHHRAGRLVGGGGHHIPFCISILHHLCVQGGQSQRGVGIRAVQVYPE